MMVLKRGSMKDMMSLGVRIKSGSAFPIVDPITSVPATIGQSNPCVPDPLGLRGLLHAGMDLNPRVVL